uniref:Arylsulfatase a and related enzymes n=1 Tax=uncultured delta proteobacterium HF0130_05G09 TaxID=710827 RepID=E0XXL1_9DELT|nr:arylsulfatase a and related enzymes [uncultured delta proteobacterium HF0130_05G09]
MKKNLIFIQSDQHNYNCLGCNGDEVVNTPNLDKLAKKGISFTNVYSASPICVPSRMSFLTGMMPYENEIWTNDQILNSAIPTYAHAMGAGGYNPIQFGRLHLNGIDQYHGFTERYVGDHNRNHLGSPREPGTHNSELKGTAGPSRISLKKSGIGLSAYEIHDRVVTDTVIDYLKNNKTKLLNSDKGFSISIGYMLPHQPYICSQNLYEKYEKKINLPKVDSELIEECHSYIKWWREKTDTVNVSTDEIKRCRIAYWALVEVLDSMIGEIINILEKLDLIENTLIVYTSDHGDQLGEHGLWWKQTFYEDSVKVPVIISSNNNFPNGEINNRIISHYDIMETMLDLTDCPKLTRSKGKSLKQLINNPKDKNWDDIVFSEYCTDDSSLANYSSNLGGKDIHSKEGGVQNRMIRYKNWKFNYYEGYKSQLFDLDNDPKELDDLYQSKACNDIKDKLHRMIKKSWDPKLIHKKMILLKKEQLLQQKWANKTDPPDQLRWNLDPNTQSSKLY